MSNEHEENIKKEFAAAEGVPVDAIETTEATEQPKEVISELEVSMLEAAQNLEFEKAALLRDQIDALKNKDKVASKASKSGYKKKSKGIYNKDGIPKRKRKP